MMTISAMSSHGSKHGGGDKVQHQSRRTEAAIDTVVGTGTETSGDPGRISTANNRPLYRLSAEQLFARLDRDSKGYLEASDFVRISPAGARAAAAAHAKQNERAQQQFERMDADGDGQLSEAEFKAALATMVAAESHGKAKGVAKFRGESEAAPPPPAPADGEASGAPVADPATDTSSAVADGTAAVTGGSTSLAAAAALQAYASVASVS